VSDGERAVDPAALRMRAEFDRAFSSPAVPPARDRARLLGIRVGGDPFALALDDVMAIHVDRKIVPVPSAAATLLGIASFRGALAPVHDLRLVLGYPARAPTRWLVLVGGQTPIGLAFDAFEGQLVAPSAQQPPPAAVAAAPRSRSSALTRGLVHAGDTIRPLIDVAAVLTALGSRPAGTPENKER
jgi:chemotaxis signal transduction protein